MSGCSSDSIYTVGPRGARNYRKNNDAKIPIDYLTEKDREYVAIFLDKESKWAHVAEKLGIEPKAIGWMRDRQHERGSVTFTLLDDLNRKSVSVEELIKAVKTCQVEPVEEYLQQKYPDMKQKYLGRKERRYRTARLPYLSRPSPTCPCTSLTEHVPRVLLCYTTKNLRVVLNMINFLSNNNIIAKIGMPQGLAMNEDSYIPQEHFITENEFQRLNFFTLILISPRFLPKNLEKSLKYPATSNNNNFLTADQVLGHVVLDKTRIRYSESNYALAVLKGVSCDEIPKIFKRYNVYSWPDEYWNLSCYINLNLNLR